MCLEIASGIGELGEDEDFLAVEFLGLEQADQLLQLIVVLWIELPGLLDELHDLVKVEEGLGHHLINPVLAAVEAFNGVEHFLGHDVLGLVLVTSLAPKLKLEPRREAENLTVLSLPTLQALLFGVCLAVNLQESQQLLEQAVAGHFERGDRALEPFEKVGSNQTHDLLLPILLKRIDALVRSRVPGERVVHGKGE